MKGIDWTTLWKKEDWWACWVGGTVLLIALFKMLPELPKWETWTWEKPLAFAQGGVGDFALSWVTAFIFVFVFTSIGLAVMKGLKAIKYHLPGMACIFGIAMLAYWIGNYKLMDEWGLEVVLWALFLGLFISNVLRVPRFMKGSVNTEFYIKCGLVMLGAEILFSIIIKGGLVGMGQAVFVVLGVWLFGYWLGRRLGMTQQFSGIMATGVAICGVSAAIAAGGALRGDPKHVAYVISWVLIIAIPMMVIMPPIAAAVGMTPAVAGAWVGGVIDTTAAVIAAGELIGGVALPVAALVKMAQNVLIGFTAFLIACWATLVLERKPGAERPPFIEIWYRFPKFIVGFILASFIFSVLEGIWGVKAVDDIIDVTKIWRPVWFILAFVCIGLDTRFLDLARVGGGKPALVFVIAQIFNAIWTLGICWLLWGGILFEPPIK